MFTLTNLLSTDPAAHARSEAFILENPDKGIRARSPGQVAQAVGTGQAQEVTTDGELCGVSLVYKYEAGAGQPTYSEIGTMRITANGFGLQTFIAALQIVHVWIEEFDQDPPPIFAVVTPGTASEHILTALGMTPWSPTPDLRLLRQSAGVPFDPNKAVLCATRETLVTGQDLLRRLHVEGTTFQTPKNNGLIGVRMGWFGPDKLDVEF